MHHSGFVYLIIQCHVFDNGLEQRSRIALVIDGKVVGKTYFLGLSP